MKKLIILLIITLLINCNGKQNSKDANLEGEFLCVMEVDALDLDGNIVNFNVGYHLIIGENTIKDCPFNDKDELNKTIVETTIRSVVRKTISGLTYTKIDSIDKESLKTQINKYLEKGNRLNGKLVTCNVSLRLFAITIRN